jgi:large subunit ribosomal protein L17
MLSNMAASLILHKRINTTLAKAKALRGYVEPLINRSKDDSTHSRRMVFSYLQNKEAVTTLFREVSVKVASRPGGYTRILKTGNRLGDNAEMCMMELVDFNENMLAAKEAPKARTTRRSRGSKEKADVAKESKPAAKAPKAPQAADEAKAADTPAEESTDSKE